MPKISFQNIDKVVHFGFYFVFCLLWYMFLCIVIKKKSKALHFAFTMTYIYGMLIEIAQDVFTNTRSGDVKDMLANTMGGFMAVMVVMTINKTFLNK